jgi:SWI/SNF-related matrix-associated actin-dependent regulator 1 of chromatin subfamily A
LHHATPRYSTITSQPDRAFLRKVEFSVMVVDEGHMLKNMSAQRYGHLMAFQVRV